MIKAPAWAKNAKPTTRGWVDARTGEVLVSRKFSDREVKEWKKAQGDEAAVVAPAPAPEPIIEADPVVEEVAPTAEPLIEADPINHDHTSMTKSQLVDHAALEHGINLDASMTKAQMNEDLESQI